MGATLTAPSKNEVEEIGSAVETVEELGNEESAKRGRGSAPDVNYRKIFTNKEEAEKNPPAKDDNGVIKPVEGFRIYVVGNMVTKTGEGDDAEISLNRDDPKLCYVWARNGEQATAFYATEKLSYLAEPLVYGERGKQSKIDNNYVMLLDFLVMKWNNPATKNEATIELNKFLDNFKQYAPYLASKGYVRS